MVTSISDREPLLNQETSTVAAESARLTVTGLDESGQMFREAAPILQLDGRDCIFRSKFRPEIGSWILIELDFSKPGSKRTTLQGQVRAAHAEGVATNLFQVRVELEAAQEVKIASGLPKIESRPVKLQPDPISTPTKKDTGQTPNVVTGTVRSVPEKAAPFEIPPPVKINQSALAPSADEEVLNSAQPADAAGFDRTAGRSETAPVVKRQVAPVKASSGPNPEEIEQRAVSSSIEKMVREAIEKQIPVSYGSALQTLNSDLSYQLVGRLATSQELRVCIEKMAKEILEEQIGGWRDAVLDARENLDSQGKEITRSLETSMTEMDDKLNVARDTVTAALDRLQALEKESADEALHLQKTVEQMNHTVRSATEKFEAHITAQLNSWSVQFKKHLEDVSREKSAQFVADFQQQMAVPKEAANEILEKLAAGLQLARGTVRIQEEQIAGLSRQAATEFEKEIKAVLIRLAGSV